MCRAGGQPHGNVEISIMAYAKFGRSASNRMSAVGSVGSKLITMVPSPMRGSSQIPVSYRCKRSDPNACTTFEVILFTDRRMRFCRGS